MGIMLLLSDFVFGKTDLERENAPPKRRIPHVRDLPGKSTTF